MRTRPAPSADEQARQDAAYNWWTTREMAKRACDVTDEQVRRWIKRGLLPAKNIAVGKRRPEYRIRPEDGQRFIDETMAA